MNVQTRERAKSAFKRKEEARLEGEQGDSKKGKPGSHARKDRAASGFALGARRGQQDNGRCQKAEIKVQLTRSRDPPARRARSSRRMLILRRLV